MESLPEYAGAIQGSDANVIIVNLLEGTRPAGAIRALIAGGDFSDKLRRGS